MRYIYIYIYIYIYVYVLNRTEIDSEKVKVYLFKQHFAQYAYYITMTVLQWILQQLGYLLWQMHFNLHFWLLKIIRSHVNVQKVESISGTLAFSLSLMCRSLVYANPGDCSAPRWKIYKLFQIDEKFTCLSNSLAVLVHRVKSAYGSYDVFIEIRYYF